MRFLHIIKDCSKFPFHLLTTLLWGFLQVISLANESEVIMCDIKITKEVLTSCKNPLFVYRFFFFFWFSITLCQGLKTYTKTLGDTYYFSLYSDSFPPTTNAWMT